MNLNPGRAVVLLAVIPLLFSGCGGASNPAAQTHTQRTGVYETRGPRSVPSVAWKFKAGGPIEASPSASAGVVYFGSAAYLYALDAADGRLRWNLKVGSIARSSPVVHRGIVYVGSDDGALYAADARTGATKWISKTYGYFILLDEQGTCCEDYLKTNLPPPGRDYFRLYAPFTGWGIAASPVITGAQIYFGDEAAYFYAADLATGEISWVAAAHTGSTSVSAAEGNTIYYVIDGGLLFSMDAKTGRENWRITTEHNFHDSSLVLDHGTLYATGQAWDIRGPGNADLLAIDALTGKEKWRFAGDGMTTAPIVSGNKVYFTAGESLFAFDAQSGVKLWEVDRSATISHAPALADGIIYLSNSGSHIYAIAADTGQVIWTGDAPCQISGALTIADGALFFGCDDGYVYALR
jgi:eukaryotic-like serine/threonine-protein kinase